jgi:hypothetical protein
MDFDPRDDDSRNDDRVASRHPYGDRRPDDDGRSLGRGSGNSRQSENDDVGSERVDARWPDRDRALSDHGVDSREPFTRDLELPKGQDRELVRDRDREYTLRGSETRTLATVGAFRVVSSRDLRDHHDRPLDPRSSDLRHLREQGLVESVRVPGSREHAVALTKDGRSLLEHNRSSGENARQTLWHGVKRERELGHDVQVYRAYERAAARLASGGARVERIRLDHELKREYQTWLHARDRDRSASDGRPDGTDDEIRRWAREHDLPYFDEQVHFPDLRIEYRDRDGREDHEDVEVTTEHYRGAHAASVAQSGFSCYRGSSLRIGGGRGGSRGGGRQGGLAEEMLE